MENKRTQSNTLMWIARISGLIISVIWLYYLIRHTSEIGIRSLLSPTSTGIILFLLITTLSIGVGIAWSQPLNGGKFIIVLSVLLGIYNYFSTSQGRIIAVVSQALPYFLVGLLSVQSQLFRNDET